MPDELPTVDPSNGPHTTRPPGDPATASLGDLPTVGYEGGDPPRVPPVATGFADDDTPDIPGYVVEGELGRGGMGVVYKARQTSLNRPVALKLLPTGKALGPLVRQRFQAEAESAARIVHPGVVAVYEISEHRGRPYFALEYCPGGSLADKLAGTPQPPRQAAELVEKIAWAVEAAHAAGVVHRDLKPHNVLFATDGAPKVTDFGLAKWVGGDSSLTTDGAILGTPSYMAPEQARGDSKAVGPAADVYALGAVLYECLTGRPPFRGATLMDTLALLAKADPVPPRALVPGVPKDLETVCLRCLEKDAGKRYPTAAAVADDLRRFLDGRPTVARPVSLPERVWKTFRRRPEIGVILGVVCAAVGTVIGVLASSNAGLARERNAAVAAQRAAEASQAQADAQRRKADTRLAAAVDAVETMTGRASGSEWLDPRTVAARRRLIEDAVAFYDRLAATDADDPVVMRESAKARRRAGQGWLSVGETGKALVALRESVRLADALAAADPADPDRANAAAEARTALGHARALDGDYQAALADYQAALGLTERAVAGRPGAAEFVLTRASAHANLARYHSVSAPPLAAGHAAEAERQAAALAAAPDRPFAHGLAHLQALVLVGNGHLQADRPAEAGAKFDAADAAYAALGPPPGVGAVPEAPPAATEQTSDRPPPARAGGRPVAELTELWFFTKSQIDIQRGAVRLRTARGPADLAAAARLMRAGLVPLDLLLRAVPRSFPYRVAKYQTLGALSDIAARQGDLAGRDAATAELDRLGAEMVADKSSAVWVLAGGAVRRTHRLMADIRAGRLARFPGEAAELLKLADALPPTAGAGQTVRYNVACCSAELAKVGPAADREGHAAAAVRLLAGLAGSGYFKAAEHAENLAADPDLAPLRDRPDFKQLLASLPEMAPPPRPAK